MSENVNVIDSLDKVIEKAYDVMGKVLTTKTRKALPDKVFCGPNRSFPCQDCIHVRTAKIYLARSKFSKATKKKIAACINRKAKQLGCKVTKKAKADVELTKDEKSLYNSDIFKSTKELVEESISNPEMSLNFD